MDRLEPHLAPEFRKNEQHERFLRDLNAALDPFEQELYVDRERTQPLVFIVGVPRSGTTLASQILCSSLKVGYVTNLMATLWRAPVTGIRLFRGVLGDLAPSSFQSEFGRTKGAHEPHEFGYFWSHHLDYQDFEQKGTGHEDSIDWTQLRRVLANMASEFESPTLFKPLLLNWHIARAQRELAPALYVRLRRNSLENALSLLRLRQDFTSGTDQWPSLKPREYSWLQHEEVSTQVAGQVHFIDKHISGQLSLLPASTYLEVDYEAMCADPRGFVETVRTAIASLQGEASLRAVPPTAFEVRTLTERFSPRVVHEVDAALRRFRAADY